MRTKFIEKRFNRSSRLVIAQANQIIDEYVQMGFTLTLRQLYYQFVSRALLVNNHKSYKRLGVIISDARCAGLIDWHSIEDRTRYLRGQPHWSTPGDIIASASSSFRMDKWENQDYRVEVWIEKEALVGVIEGVCAELDIDYFACKGYVSQSEQFNAGARLNRYMRKGQEPIVLHLGDHDPSGIDMTRDNLHRLFMFGYGCPAVKRIALNMDQVEEHDPPPNYAKITDSRYAGYVSEYGQSSWELDALDPSVIKKLIRDSVLPYRDPDRWDQAVKLEQSRAEDLRLLSAQSAEAIRHLKWRELAKGA